MPWYHFWQKNSGGSCIGPENIYIEAKTSLEANKIALTVGVYFNGVDNGIDCDCCGDRWLSVDEYDAADVPLLYGEPITMPAPDHVLIVPLDSHSSVV